MSARPDWLCPAAPAASKISGPAGSVSMKGARYGLRGYLWVLMAGLLLQGLGSLLFRLMPALPAHAPLLVRGAFGIDFWHALIHLAWGLIGLTILRTSQTRRPLAALALIFGLFYTALGLWGVLVHHPLGLELDLPENAFHLVAGPVAGLLGWLNWT